MSDTLFDLSQYKSASSNNYRSDWVDATGADPSWNEPSLAPTSALSINALATDAAQEWRSCAEFTITLESGQTVQGNFVPCLEGEYRMHQFDFIGPVSPTGFNSHFVLAVEAEEYPHPRDYAQAYVQDLVARFEAAQQQQAKSKKRVRPVAEAQAPQGQGIDNDSSTQETTMAEDETLELNHATVEVVEELSPSEEADRQRLELKVERAFYEAGCSLRELRDRRLYRSMHQTFEEYCRIRFGFTYRHGNQLIAGSLVIENLQMGTNRSQTDAAQMGTNRSQILPTKLEQVKPLTALEPEEQRQVWDEAVEAAGGMVPSGRLVRNAVLRHVGIVERLKQKNPSPPEFAQGDVVEIKALKRSPLHPFNGMWGTIEHVGSFSYTVRISIAKDVQQCKGEEMTRIDDEYTSDIKAMGQRIKRLVELDLEPVDFWILEGLQRSKCFTPRQLLYLERMESDYRLGADGNWAT